jgi:hypothetical protein
MQRLSGGLFKNLAKKTNADYNPVADAEAILAEGTLVPQYAGTGSLFGALAI